ncbi:phosphoglycolate phosphatase [Candidatus Woesearchaeota archaeon]|nr:phosphoglycolate phosphatase [Candidatus Woesearchaeota archaeon]
MRIYFASQSFYPHIGGVSTYLLNLQKELKKRGNEVIELHLRPSNAPNHEIVEGIEVHRVPKEPLDMDMLKGYSLFKEAIYKESHNIKGSFNRTPDEMEGYDDFILINDAFGQEVRDMLNKDPADIIHIHDFQLIYLYRYIPRGTPLVFTWHIPLSNKVSTHLKKYLLKHLKEYDKVIFSSQEYINAAVKMGLPKGKCELIYPICNTTLFRPLETNREQVLDKYKIPHDANIIMCVQRIDQKSGHEQLIKAMPKILEEIPDAKLVFVGGKSMSSKISNIRKKYEDRVEELITKLGLEEDVIFTGNIDYAELPELYNSVDVVALCSKIEGFGLSVTEAMSCARPIVANNVGGIPIQVKDGENGFLVRPHDADATADRIITLLKDKELRKRFGEKSLEFVKENFSLHKGVEEHIYLYNNLMKEKDVARRLEKLELEDIGAFITDYDRTITDSPGVLESETVENLHKLDTVHILATGRKFEYVKELFDRFGLWECIVCENGSIVYFPKSKKTIKVNSSYLEEARGILMKNGISANFGEVIISVNIKEKEKVKEKLHHLTKNLNYIYNVDEMMILPKFVNKGSGVKIALNHLGIDPQNTIVVGDAENDIDLFRTPGYKVALSNAHPRLKLIADEVTEKPGSKGIREIVKKLAEK